jgi:hypothetical protein
MTFNYIMNAVLKFEKTVSLVKKTDDKNLISDTLKSFVRLISFNGAGFDLYFLLEKLL